MRSWKEWYWITRFRVEVHSCISQNRLMVWEYLCLTWKLTNGQRRLSRIGPARRPGLQMSAVLFPQHHEYYSLGSGTEWLWWQRGKLFTGSVSPTSPHKADLATTTIECLYYQQQRPMLSPAYSSKHVWCRWHASLLVTDYIKFLSLWIW